MRWTRMTGAVIAMLVSSGCGGSGLTVTDVERLLSQRVPIGSTAQHVDAVLDSMNVEHSDFDPAKRDILAIWRRTERTLFEDKAIQARIQFDEAGLVKKVDVKEVSTGT